MSRMEEAQRKILTGLAGEGLYFDRPLAPYTTMKTGGAAECLYEPDDPLQLSSVLAFISAEAIPYRVIGNGSNMIVTDRGVRGVIIVIGKAMSGFSCEEGPEGVILTAGAGLSISAMISGCCEEGLSGLEFLSWIPGTVGGAVAMNAGAFGFETGERVREIHALSPKGRAEVFSARGLEFGYRHCGLAPGTVIVSVAFALDRAEPAFVAEAVAEYMRRRKGSQPYRHPSAGSIFKNPPGRHAGALIEAAGLKGERRGGAMISEIHGNFIVNTGGASAEDVLGLMELARRRVHETSGIELEAEVKIVGER